MQKHTVFISGKITGDEYYRARFFKAEALLSELGFAVMNPAILPDGFGYKDYINICKAMINACECVCMLPEWRESTGATGENIYAHAAGKVIFEYRDALKKIGELSGELVKG